METHEVLPIAVGVCEAGISPISMFHWTPRGSGVRGRTVFASSKGSVDPDEVWEVLYVGDKEIRDGVAHYETFWEGFKEPTWEPLNSFPSG